MKNEMYNRTYQFSRISLDRLSTLEIQHYNHILLYHHPFYKLAHNLLCLSDHTHGLLKYNILHKIKICSFPFHKVLAGKIATKIGERYKVHVTTLILVKTSFLVLIVALVCLRGPYFWWKMSLFPPGCLVHVLVLIILISNLISGKLSTPLPFQHTGPWCAKVFWVSQLLNQT